VCSGFRKRPCSNKRPGRAHKSTPAAGARDVCLSLNSGEKADIQLLRLRAQKRTSMLIRLAGLESAVATTLSLKAKLAIQPRLADGNVADGRGSTLVGSLSRMTRSAALPAMITPVKSWRHCQAASAVTILNVASTGAFSAGFSTSPPWCMVRVTAFSTILSGPIAMTFQSQTALQRGSGAMHAYGSRQPSPRRV